MYAHEGVTRRRERAERKRPYLLVFGLLAVLTVVEVQTPGLRETLGPNAGTVITLLLMTLATAKATAVVLYYMHLRYEPRLLALIPVATLLVLLILAFFLFNAGPAAFPGTP